ncbi:MAG: glycosyltransferase family 4 protein, partial [Endomicrobiia bacterium]
DKIIALTNGEKNESLQFGVGKESQWEVIPSGIDYRLQVTDYKLKKLKEELNIKDDEIIIGTVARLEPIKGVKYFLEAIKNVVDNYNFLVTKCKFLIVGDGEERESMELFVKENNLKERIIFTGMREDVLELISIMDIYVQPSLNEGMGKTIVMASMLGKPVVATKVQGIPDVVKDDVSGLLVNAKNSQLIADAIIKLVTDRSLRERLGLEGKKWVNKIIDGYPQFSIEYMLYKLEKLYAKI